MTAWERAQHGWPASYPIVQFPNAPLIVAVAGLLVAMTVSGSLSGYGQAVFYAAAAVWAWLELTDGVNLPRRVLGAAGLAFVVAKVGAAFGA